MDTPTSPLLAEGLFQDLSSPAESRIISSEVLLPESPRLVEFSELTTPATNHLISLDLPEHQPLTAASKKRKAQEINDLREELDQQRFLTAQANEIVEKSQDVLAQAQITLTALTQKLQGPHAIVQQSTQQNNSIAKLIARKKKSRASEEDDKYEAEYRIIKNEFKTLDSKKYAEYRQYVKDANSEQEKGKRRNWQYRKILSEMLLHNQDRLEKSTKDVADLHKQIQSTQEKISDLQKKLNVTAKSSKRPRLDTTATAQPVPANDTEAHAHLLSTATLLKVFGHQFPAEKDNPPIAVEIKHPLPLLTDPNNAHIEWVIEDEKTSSQKIFVP